MIKTVIFDMDGVIVDSEPVHRLAYNTLFNQLDIDVSPEVYASFTGNSTKNIFERLKSIYNLKQEVNELVEAKRSLFNTAFDEAQELALLDGVKPLIMALYAGGMQLVLASSSAHVTIERIFNRFQLHHYFDHIVSGEEFPKSKPDPTIFIEAARRSKTAIENCIVIEDSTNGIKAAKAAGIFCVGYNSFHTKLQDYSDADLVINHFDELDFLKIRHLK